MTIAALANAELDPAIAEILDGQPVSKLVWLHRDRLFANDYNPNHQAPPESDLLEQSLLEDGWTEPIVARSTGEIVDGFHRHSIAGRPKMLERYHGFVPVVVLSDDKSRADQMMSTIRHNRARGQHGVRPMGEIIRDLVDVQGLGYEEISVRLGMEEEEIERLYDIAGQPERISKGSEGFKKGWKPSDVRTVYEA